jgi:hypothetical protein
MLVPGYWEPSDFLPKYLASSIKYQASACYRLLSIAQKLDTNVISSRRIEDF